MPELPEVETTLRGIEPALSGKVINKVIIRNPKLRWPIPLKLKKAIIGKRVNFIQRRGKYLLLNFDNGTLILHLGMSGSLRILPLNTPHEKHDHFELHTSKHCLRLRDPRRFGAVLWTEKPIEEHKLLSHLGPEPLTETFNIDYLLPLAKRRKVSIKTFIMDSKSVVGVGNIYANESLFMAGISPIRLCNKVSKPRLNKFIHAIKLILAEAIKQGGTTLSDFQQTDGNPGYFAQKLDVYGRAGKPCVTCGKELKEVRITQRSTVYCTQCQK